MFFKRITSELIDDFADYLKSDFRSEDTIYAYVRSVRIFCLGKRVKDLNKKFFENLKLDFIKKGRDKNTISRNVFAIKKFGEWQGLNLNWLKCEKKKNIPPEPLSEEEIAKIQSLPLTEKLDFRNRTFFEFLLNTGCRISEALAIDAADINWEKETITIKGKGDKQRIVFFGNSAEWIKKYLNGGNSPLFMNQYGKRWKRINAFVAIKKLGKRAGLAREIYPHLLRHTYINKMLDIGVDPRIVQELAGHTDLETTLKFYRHVSFKGMETASNLFKSQFPKSRVCVRKK